jgi:hypothetical protein
MPPKRKRSPSPANSKIDIHSIQEHRRPTRALAPYHSIADFHNSNLLPDEHHYYMHLHSRTDEPDMERVMFSSEIREKQREFMNLQEKFVNKKIDLYAKKRNASDDEIDKLDEQVAKLEEQFKHDIKKIGLTEEQMDAAYIVKGGRSKKNKRNKKYISKKRKNKK